MYLDIANRQRIDDPTPEQIGQSFGSLPADAPFLILNADEEHFIQATPADDGFRVEWRQEAEQRFMIVPTDRALEAFLAFRRWDEPALRAFPWRRLRVWNDPYRYVIVGAAVLMIIALFRLWSAMR
jgi:hypothetical protein